MLPTSNTPLGRTASGGADSSAPVTIFTRSLELPVTPLNTHGYAPTLTSPHYQGVSQTEQVADSQLAVDDLEDEREEERKDHYSPASSLDDAATYTKPQTLQPMSIESPPTKHFTPQSANERSEPLIKPHPNWHNPNVDLARGLSTPYPYPAAEPHVIPATLPWLQRWVDKRWRFLFPAYRRLDVWGLRGFSVCELIFIAIYGLVNLALIVAGIAQLATAPHDDGDQGQLYNIGMRYGTIGTINVLILLFPIARSNVWQYIFGMSFERSVFYHKWIARVAIAELAIHGGGIYADSYYNGRLRDDAYSGGVTGEYASGSISFFIGVAIVILSLYPLRRYLHETFLRVHMVLFVAFLVFGFIHDGTVALVVPALILYAVDWVLRISMWRKPVRVLNVALLPGGVTRITFQKDHFHYQAGQYVFICIPAVSPFEWHPFSLSSSPHHPVLTVHCKTIGRWTRRLAELAQKGQEENRDWTKLRMHTEGPYGNLSVPLAHYSSVMLVGGGIGVTPLGSVYNSLVHDHYRGTRRLRQLKLVWSVREPALIRSLYDDVRKAESVDDEERAADTPAAHFFNPKSLAQRDALVKNDASATPRRVAINSGIQPLAGRVKNAFHVTRVDSVDKEQLRGVQSYYGEWIKEGRPELAVAFAEVRDALLAQDQHEPVSVTVVPSKDVGAVTGASAVSGEAAAAASAAQPLELGVNRCAVLACGPRMLIEDVRAFCIRQSTGGVFFDLHEEEFSW